MKSLARIFCIIFDLWVAKNIFKQLKGKNLRKSDFEPFRTIKKLFYKIEMVQNLPESENQFFFQISKLKVGLQNKEFFYFQGPWIS